MVKSPIAAMRLVVASKAASVGRFTAWLESTGELLVVNTRQPLVDGGRVLLARGFDPTAPLTMRHEGSAHDSFRPAPLREWARWTYKEGESVSLRRSLWIPFPTDRNPQKSRSEPSVAPEDQETENRFLGGTGQRRGGYPQSDALLGRVA
jgi:hypothetical protein